MHVQNNEYIKIYEPSDLQPIVASPSCPNCSTRCLSNLQSVL